MSSLEAIRKNKRSRYSSRRLLGSSSAGRKFAKTENLSISSYSIQFSEATLTVRVLMKFMYIFQYVW